MTREKEQTRVKKERRSGPDGRGAKRKRGLADLDDIILDAVTSLPKKVAKLEWVPFERPKRYFQFLYSKRNFLICLAAGLMTYLLTEGHDEEIRAVLAVFVFTAGCWMLEVFPLYITGLMVPVALTILGIFSPTEAFAPFAHPVNFLLIGGLVLGQSVTKFGLDRRLAYAMLKYSRGKIDRLVLLVMLTTAFLSMWMSNTVAIAMLLPVVLTILSAIPDVYVNLKRKMLLGMTMAATLGGMAMMTGSTPNMIAAAALEAERSFGYMQWAYYGVPVVLISLFLAFGILKTKYPSPDVTLDLTDILDQEKTAGPLSKQQKGVIYIFGFTIFLWFFGSQVERWLGLPSSVSSAAIVSVLSVLLMFGFGLLDMKDVSSIKWEIMFLVGGGILLGEAMIKTGAATEIGDIFASSGSILPEICILLLFLMLALVMTNFISNTATAAILVPIAIKTAEILDVSAVPFVMGIGLVASVAFITPVGTPSTAMIYSTGRIPKAFLIKNGIIVGLVTLVVVLVITWFLPIPT